MNLYKNTVYKKAWKVNEIIYNCQIAQQTL